MYVLLYSISLINANAKAPKAWNASSGSPPNWAKLNFALYGGDGNETRDLGNNNSCLNLDLSYTGMHLYGAGFNFAHMYGNTKEDYTYDLSDGIINYNFSQKLNIYGQNIGANFAFNYGIILIDNVNHRYWSLQLPSSYTDKNRGA